MPCAMLLYPPLNLKIDINECPCHREHISTLLHSRDDIRELPCTLTLCTSSKNGIRVTWKTAFKFLHLFAPYHALMTLH